MELIYFLKIKTEKIVSYLKKDKTLEKKINKNLKEF
jgi:hypothetical protein